MNRDIGIFIANVENFKEEKKQYLSSVKLVNLKDNICAFCHNAEAQIPLKKAVPSTLLLRKIFLGDGLCINCAFVLTLGILRQKNFTIEGGRHFKTFNHVDIWDNVLTKKIPTPNFISLTTTYKKHNIFYTEINYTDRVRFVVFNQRQVVYALDKDRILFDIVFDLYNNWGQTKDAIYTGELQTQKLTNEKFKEIKEIYSNLSKIKKSIFLQMLTTYVPKNKK